MRGESEESWRAPEMLKSCKFLLYFKETKRRFSGGVVQVWFLHRSQKFPSPLTRSPETAWPDVTRWVSIGRTFISVFASKVMWFRWTRVIIPKRLFSHVSAGSVVAHRIFVESCGIFHWGTRSVIPRHVGSQLPNQGLNPCPLHCNMDS